jgi:pseudouridine kinase
MSKEIMEKKSKSVLCMGAILLDELYFADQPLQWHTSNPAQKKGSLGGVVSNIAQHLAQLDVEVALLTAFGSDLEAHFIQQQLEAQGISYSESIVAPSDTGKYVSIVNPDGSLQLAVCADACTPFITPEYIAAKLAYLMQFDILVIDTNLSAETIQACIDFCVSHQKILIIEPVSVPKAHKLAALSLAGVFLITPNQDELNSILENSPIRTPEALLSQGVSQVWLRKGDSGSSFHSADGVLDLPAFPVEVVDSTGAGDAALAAWIYAYIQGESSANCIALGHALAAQVLQQHGSVVQGINPQKLKSIHSKYSS